MGEAWEHFYISANLPEKRAEALFESFAKLEMIEPHLWVVHRVVWSQNFVTGLANIYAKRSTVPPSRPTHFCTENCPQTGVSGTEMEFPDRKQTDNPVIDTGNALPPTPPLLKKSKVKLVTSSLLESSLNQEISSFLDTECSRQTGISPILSPDGGTFSGQIRIGNQTIRASFLNQQLKKLRNVENVLTVLYRCKDAADIPACVIAGMSNGNALMSHRDESTDPRKVREWKDLLVRTGVVS
jgi:hypothetical protein